MGNKVALIFNNDLFPEKSPINISLFVNKIDPFQWAVQLKITFSYDLYG